MTLTCGPPPKNVDVGEISGSEWKFKEREIKDGVRIGITTSDSTSELTVSNVILADIGKSKQNVLTKSVTNKLLYNLSNTVVV